MGIIKIIKQYIHISPPFTSGWGCLSFRGVKSFEAKQSVLMSCALLFSVCCFSQGEANNWYFGNHGGITFNGGNPVGVLNGQVNTMEGCASISNAAGQLLFYTDGITVYNRNHLIMPNGTGLMGDISSTQSATIVPLPSSTTLFYLFTLDAEAKPNGFRYSIVDISLNGGLGDVTSTKNILIYTPSAEKLAVIKHNNNVDYWVVTHGMNNNTFYAHSLTSSGLNMMPVSSNSGLNVGSLEYGQCMKISPDGTKIGFVQLGTVQLFDFNTTTGVVSHAQTLVDNPILSHYGVEFSTNSKVMYVSELHYFHIFQFNLLAANIPTSITAIANVSAGALQLGPDGKIYLGGGWGHLSAINNPNVVGIGCNFQSNVVDLLGNTCTYGLPSFVQSFLYSSLIFQNNCVGESVPFDVNTTSTLTSATWSFGDGGTSTAISPNHTYTTAGTFPVTVTTTDINSNVETKNKSITIYPKPTLIAPIINLKQCDDNLDGFSAFNLNEAIPLLVSSPAGLTISFHETLAEAQNNTNPIANTTIYTNQIVSNDTIFVRVQNANGCYSTAQLNLVVSTTLIPASFQKTFIACDDTASGSNTDGIAAFNFSSATAQIQALYPSGQLLNISYYKSLADALAETNAISNIANFTNTTANTQNIFVRVDSQLNNDCLGLGHHITLIVEPIPIVQPQIIKHCDDNQDGIFAFNTTNLQTTLLNGLTNVTVTYSTSGGAALPSPLPNPFNSNSQTINVKVTNNTTAACFYNSTIQFVVDVLPQAFPIPITLTTACDDEVDPALQNGIYAFNTTNFETTILGTQTGMTVKYYDANNNLLPSPLPNPFATATQTVRVEVISPINGLCKGVGYIPFVVNPLPRINLTGTELVCTNNPLFTKIIDAGLLNPSLAPNYSYVWKLNSTVIPTANQYSLTINTAGTYTVKVTSNKGCSSTRTIIVTASNKAKITKVDINDWTENENTIEVHVSSDSVGDYQYSLDNHNFQNSPVFTGLGTGQYTVFVDDKKGCGYSFKDIFLLIYPKFFSPNGDGINDYWRIKFSENEPNLTVKIFDRFGTLIKELRKNTSWNGTDNSNNPVNSDDYWFVVTRQDGKVYKGHFALVR